MKHVTIVSNYPSGSNGNVIQIKNADEIEFKNVIFEGPAYNTVMTGQVCENGKYISKALFENCTFNEICRHISIWFAAWKDNAVLTIRNCKFKTCEQFLCLSDFHAAGGSENFNNKLTINIENCEIENYERGENDPYSGIILCDSRKTTAANFEELNPFGDGKVSINITNTKVAGKILTIENFKMGSKDKDQMLYLYRAVDGKNYDYNAETEKFFPRITIDGQTAVWGSAGGMIESEEEF